VAGPNAFSKQETVLFDQLLEGYQGATVATRMATVAKFDQVTMERTGDIIWLPQPFIGTIFSGLDQTANFNGQTQLSVPAVVNKSYSSPWVLSALNLRDLQQEGRLAHAATQRLGSQIDTDVMAAACTYGAIVVKRTVAASGFDDVAQCDASMTERGIPYEDRKLGLCPRDYNNMASNLQVAARSIDNPLSKTAYERAKIGSDIAGFEAFKMPFTTRLAAATGVGVTITNTQPLYYTPVATVLTTGVGSLNQDNRFQTISINVTSGTVKVGDCFTVAGVNAVHHIQKADTGSLKSFRIVAIVTGAGGTGTVQICPPIISAGGGTIAEVQYQNVLASPANGAVLTFLNTVTANLNPFWQGDAVQLLPGRYQPRADSGLAVMSAVTDEGFQLVMTRQGSINDLSTKYRLDSYYGVLAAQPEMMGITLFNQI